MTRKEYRHITVSPTIGSAQLIDMIREARGADYLFIFIDGFDIELPDESAMRMIDAARNSDAALLYADYRVRKPLGDGSQLVNHPLAPYQAGSVRDDFDFGHVILLDVRQLLANGLDRTIPRSDFSGLYAIRLFMSVDTSHLFSPKIIHLPEYLYISSENDNRKSGEKQFDYVNPRNAGVQKEREAVFTEFLRRNSMLLQPAQASSINLQKGDFPVEASVIIPVRDRERTIADAVQSALSQQCCFGFNVIVVDNHSCDSTTDILKQLAENDPRVIHIIPSRDDLGIGGCWNLAVNDSRCGRFAIQLDSDDKYKDDNVLEKIVECFHRDNCAMVIGSYELTDFDGNPIPPGLIDHKEWTDSNGPNNALRINGLGAPRAFFTPVLRGIGIPNVSYGEDYALGLRISRDYRIGRIYESLYLCRRWQGNSDANLSQEKVNANNFYKDWLRGNEMKARHKKICRPEEQESYPGIEAEEGNMEETGIMEFVNKQLDCWPLARKNHQALDMVEQKNIEVGGFSFRILFNPARALSSGAKTDPASIAARPCFLCTSNRPAEQLTAGIAEGFELLVNPFPVFKGHLTIPSLTHRLQSLSSIDNLGATLFEFCKKLSGFTVFYNGAKCGASAPDHLHFQAVPSGEFGHGLKTLGEKLPYRNIYFHATTPLLLETALADAIRRLQHLPENLNETEPRFNLFLSADVTDGATESCGVDVLLIPRRAHRPDCYGEEDGKMMVSPGALDVAGNIIIPRNADFGKLNAPILENILRQTTYFKDEEFPI